MERISLVSMTKKGKGIHWVSLFADGSTSMFFDFFQLNIFPEKY